MYNTLFTGNDLRSNLRDIIPDEKLKFVPRAFDIIGSRQKAVAIVEIHEELSTFEANIAAAIMRVHKNVKSVLAKESGRIGDFRTRKLRLIVGDPNTEVVHRESGCLFKLDPRSVYFSSRESTERNRISENVTEGEWVLVMFSGVGSYPIPIARRHKNVKVMAVELNPIAHNYCVENIHLNRIEDRVNPILGDVRNICPKLDILFDRILMPLPKGAHEFLDIAIPLLKDGGFLHFYHWGRETDLFSEAEDLVLRSAKTSARSMYLLKKLKVSQYSPRTWKVCLDVQIRAKIVNY